jgi:hypothetical protein
VIFNKLIKKNNFDKWKRNWATNIRDFKPSWVSELADKMTYIELNDKGKLCYARDKIFQSQNLDRIQTDSDLENSIMSRVNTNKTVINREKIIKNKLDPRLNDEFKTEIRNVGKNFRMI